MRKAKRFKELELRYLDYGMELVKDDRYRIYYNEERNVAILAIAYSREESTDLVFNGISDEAYEKLIEYMNDNNDLIIKWIKLEGTSSDYIIYCDCDYDGPWNIIDLEEYLLELEFGKRTQYKYNIVKDGEVSKF